MCIPLCFSTISIKGNNFYDFLLAVLGEEAVLQRDPYG